MMMTFITSQPDFIAYPFPFHEVISIAYKLVEPTAKVAVFTCALYSDFSPSL